MFSAVNIEDTLSFVTDEDARLRKSAKDTLDIKADEIRNSYPAKGASVISEYELVSRDVREFRLDPNVIPRSLQDYADVSGLTVEQCATIIEQTEAVFNNALLDIRKARLAGAEVIKNATGDYLTVIQPFLNELENLRNPE